MRSVGETKDHRKCWRAGGTYSSWSLVFWVGLSWLTRILRVGSIRCFLWGASRDLGRDTDSDRLCCSSSGRRTDTSIFGQQQQVGGSVEQAAGKGKLRCQPKI